MRERKELTPDEVKERLLKERKPFKIENFAKDVSVGVSVVIGILQDLQDNGYNFQKVEDYYVRSKNKMAMRAVDHSALHQQHLHFGIVSDSHLGSKMQRLDALNSMYDIFKKEGVKVVYHAGDVTDGYGVYRGQEFEVFKVGQQEQLEYTLEKYPKRPGITTHFITGNHDLRQYERGGSDVGTQIGRTRRDMEYLGQMSAEVNLGGDVVLELLHPDGPVAYALSYKAQRDINNRPPDNLPNILVYGHYHTSFYMHYRGIDFIQAPAFKDQGLWEKRKGLNPTIGGWIVTGKMSDDLHNIETIKPDLFTFNNRRK